MRLTRISLRSNKQMTIFLAISFEIEWISVLPAAEYASEDMITNYLMM